MFWYAENTNIIMITLVNGVSDLKLDNRKGCAAVFKIQWTNSYLVYYKERIKDLYRPSRCRNFSMFTHELEHISMYDSVYPLLNPQNQYIQFKPYPAPTTEQTWVHLRKNPH